MLFYAISAEILVFMFLAFLLVLGLWVVAVVSWAVASMIPKTPHCIRQSAAESGSKPRKRVPSLFLVP